MHGTLRRLHGGQRTHGTTITGLGFGRDAMDRIQNHKKKGVITDIYDRHDYAKEDKQIMETVAAHLLALAEGKVPGKVVPFARGRARPRAEP